jgi:CxxC-x17-CxxC domain-containing protein
MSYADQSLTCRDCGEGFVFTAGEQEFHAQKGFTNPPSRCPDCRTKRKAAQGGDTRRPSSGASQGEMHTATCASCGREARVPFVPTGSRPVYCSDCFRNQRNAGGGSGGGGRSNRY